MADDTAGQAIGIIGALQDAGLLRVGRSPSEPAAQIIGALAEAGLLRASPSASEPPAEGRALAEAVAVVPPPPEPKVGDEAFLGDVRAIRNAIGPIGAGQVSLVNYATLYKGTYQLDFPPNDPGWLPQIDKIIMAPRKGLYVTALVRVTTVGRSGEAYAGTLTQLEASYSLIA